MRGGSVTAKACVKGKKAGDGAERTALLEEIGVKREMKMTGCRGYLIRLDSSQNMAKQEVRNKFPGKKRQFQRVIDICWQNKSTTTLTHKETWHFKKYPAAFVSFRNEDHGSPERAMV